MTWSKVSLLLRTARTACCYLPHSPCSYVVLTSPHLSRKELEPKAPPRTVDYDVERDELAMLQTLEDPGEVDGEGGERQQQQLQQGGEGGGQQREQEEDGEEEDEEGGAEAARRRAAAQRDRKTKKDRNKEARKRAAEEVAAAAAAVKRQRRELDALPSLVEEVKDIEAEVEERRARRAADRAERVAAAPPRLGKLPFEPMPLQARLLCCTVRCAAC